MTISPRIKRFYPLLVFLIIYTVIFCFFAKTIAYTFPFLVGFLLAIITQPCIRVLKERFKFTSGVASAVSTFLLFSFIFGLLFLLGKWLVLEAMHLLQYLSKINMGEIARQLNVFAAKAGNGMKRIDGNFIRNNQKQILEITKTGLNGINAALTGILNFLTSIPAVVTMMIVMILSTYFFAKDMPEIRHKIRSLFSENTAGNVKNVSRKTVSAGWKCLASYLLIYFITFLETLILFLILGISYPLVLSLITGIADILPVLGPGTVYVPLAVFYIFHKNYFLASTLLIGWCIISVIRQIIEPKIISASIHVHPLEMLAAIYFSFTAGSFWVFLYILFMVLIYQTLQAMSILPKIFSEGKKEFCSDEIVK